jgi:hypothetical protein
VDKSITKDTNWRITVICGILFVILLSSSYLFQPSSPVFAPRLFGTYLTFFYPFIIFSLFAAFIGLIFYACIETKKKKSMPAVYKTIPFLLITPVIIQILLFVYRFIRLVIGAS